MSGERVDLTKSGKAVVHGRPSSYNNHKCRCPECTTAWAAYVKPYIKAKRARDRPKTTKGVRINL